MCLSRITVLIYCKIKKLQACDALKPLKVLDLTQSLRYSTRTTRGNCILPPSLSNHFHKFSLQHPLHRILQDCTLPQLSHAFPEISFTHRSSLRVAKYTFISPERKHQDQNIQEQGWLVLQAASICSPNL